MYIIACNIYYVIVHCYSLQWCAKYRPRELQDALKARETSAPIPILTGDGSPAEKALFKILKDAPLAVTVVPSADDEARAIQMGLFVGLSRLVKVSFNASQGVLARSGVDFASLANFAPHLTSVSLTNVPVGSLQTLQRVPGLKELTIISPEYSRGSKQVGKPLAFLASMFDLEAFTCSALLEGDHSALPFEVAESFAAMPKLRKVVILPADGDTPKKWNSFAALPFFKSIQHVQYLQIPLVPKTDLFLKGLGSLKTLRGLIVEGAPLELDGRLLAAVMGLGELRSLSCEVIGETAQLVRALPESVIGLRLVDLNELAGRPAPSKPLTRLPASLRSLSLERGVRLAEAALSTCPKLKQLVLWGTPEENLPEVLEGVGKHSGRMQEITVEMMGVNLTEALAGVVANRARLPLLTQITLRDCQVGGDVPAELQSIVVVESMTGSGAGAGAAGGGAGAGDDMLSLIQGLDPENLSDEVLRSIFETMQANPNHPMANQLAMFLSKLEGDIPVSDGEDEETGDDEDDEDDEGDDDGAGPGPSSTGAAPRPSVRGS